MANFGTFSAPQNSSPAPISSMQRSGPTTDRQGLTDEMNARYISKYANQPPAPTRKGEFLSVNIDDMIHQHGVKEHENSLIARVMLKPKVESMSRTALRDSINEIWDVPGY